MSFSWMFSKTNVPSLFDDLNPLLQACSKFCLKFTERVTRKVCWEYSSDYKLFIPFVFHEELFCFESRIIELAASQNTCWMVQTYYRWPEAQTINNFVPFSMRKMFRKFGTHSSKFRDVVNVRNPFSHSNIPWHPAS